MFEKNLADVIRGLRANKTNEEKYVMIVLEEIRKELKSNDIDIKTQAIQKLTYVLPPPPPLILLPLSHSLVDILFFRAPFPPLILPGFWNGFFDFEKSIGKNLHIFTSSSMEDLELKKS